MQTEDNTASISVVQLAKALWRGAWTIVGCAIACFLIVLLYLTQLVSPHYVSMAVLNIETATLKAAGGVLVVQDAPANDRNGVVSGEAVRIASRPFLDKVVRRAALHQQPLILEGENLSETVALRRAEKFVRDNLSVEVRRGSNLIDVEFTSPDLDLTYKVINTLLSTYLLEQGQRLLDSKPEGKAWQQAQLDEIASYLEHARKPPRANISAAEAVHTMRMAEASANAAMALFGFELSKLEAHTGRLFQLTRSKVFSEVVSPASYPKNIKLEGKISVLVLAILLGGVLGTLWVLGGHIHRRRFKSAEDIKDTFDYPVLATLPHWPDLNSEALKAAIRDIRNALVLKEQHTGPNIIQIAPVFQADADIDIGKALAASFSQIERKTLLINAQTDMNSTTQGLLDVIKGTCRLEEVLQSLGSDGAICDLLFSGMSNNRDADTWSTSQFAEFFKLTSSQYDVVILLTDSALQTSDAQLLSRMANVAVLLVDLKSVTERVIVQARNGLQLENNAVGFVLIEA